MPFAATGRSKPHPTTAATSHSARTNHVSVPTPACLPDSAASPSTSSSQTRPAPSARTATALLWRASITCLKSWPFHSVEQPWPRRGVSRAACSSDEDSTAGHCCREAHDRVMVDHKRFNVVTVIPGVTNIGHQKQQRGGPDVTVDALVERDLAAAPGVLPPANLPLVRHRRGRLHRAHGHAGRDQHRARTEPRRSLLQYPHRLLPQLRREARPAHSAVDPGGT